MTIALIEDDEAVLDSLRLLLQGRGFSVSAFSSAEAFLASPQVKSAACVVSDVRLPGKTGVDLQRMLADKGFAAPIILITGHGDIAMAVTAMRDGAVDVLPRPANPQHLIDDVHRALTIDQAQRKKADGVQTLQKRHAQLTPREQEVMMLVVGGGPNWQIAETLGITERTVKAHRGRVMEKMQAESLVHLIHMARELSLIPSRN